MLSLVSRRTLLISIAACGCSLASAGARARSIADIGGCLLEDSDVALLSNRDVQLGKTLSKAGERDVRRTTSNPELDRALDKALKRLADTFEIFPGFGFYNDFDGKNALALPKSLVPETWGTVLYGVGLFDDLMKADATGAAVMWTAAHEFGHVVGYRTGIVAALKAGQKTVKRAELHADFLAGFYLGTRKRENPDLSLYAAGQDVWNSGDRNFNHPGHHGTPEERVAAAEAGFKVSYFDGNGFRDAVKAGYDYAAGQ
jgi:hypothetical protein